jgi:hypothetical protein
MGQTSFAASSQTVTTKSSFGAAPGLELVPGPRAKLRDIEVRLAQYRESRGIDGPARLAAGVEAMELAGTEAVQNASPHDRSRRVSGAEEENVERRVAAHELHGRPPFVMPDSIRRRWR